MKRSSGLICALTFVFSLGIISLPSTVSGTYYVSGDFNGWGLSDPLYDDGTHGDVYAGDGIYAGLSIEIAVPGRYEFKIRNDDWSFSLPNSGNSWLYTELDNQRVGISYDINSYSDDWLPETNRVYVLGDLYTESWTAVGDWQGWDNADPNTAMTWISTPGIFPENYYTLTTVIPNPGTYQYKAVLTGTWDAIGADGRSVNAEPVLFETTQPGQEVTFNVKSSLGLVSVDVAPATQPIPEPATMLLLGFGLMGLVRIKITGKVM